MDKCQTIQTGIFLDNLFPQKPAVSQRQSTWVQQFCLIFQFPEFLANGKMHLGLFVTCWGPWQYLLLVCPALWHCQSCSPVRHQRWCLWRAADRGTQQPQNWDPEASLQQNPDFMRQSSDPASAWPNFQPGFQHYFLQSERPSVLTEEHLIQVISDPGSVIPAKRESGTSKMCCPVSTLK